jgi:hypothetical protein
LTIENIFIKFARKHLFATEKGKMCMNPKTLGYLSLLLLGLTAAWLFLLIGDTVEAGPIVTFEQALEYVSRADWKFYLSYANAGLLTIVATIWMVALFLYCRPKLPAWIALAGLIFMPVYCTLNLFAYISQITAVPLLVNLHNSSAYRSGTEVALALIIQQWPGSLVAFFNSLAYAILGIPSIIFGLSLRGRSILLNLAGILLALNGAASILGALGVALHNSMLRNGVLIGGVFFFLCLFPMSWVLLRNIDNQVAQ